MFVFHDFPTCNCVHAKRRHQTLQTQSKDYGHENTNNMITRNYRYQGNPARSPHTSVDIIGQLEQREREQPEYHLQGRPTRVEIESYDQHKHHLD